jgi:hypothetical protein
MHVHANEDEHFLVLEGTLHVANGNEKLDIPAGATVTVKKGVPHAWANLGEIPVHFLIIFSPGHIEEMFMEIAAAEGDVALSSAASDRFGTALVGPTLESIRSSRRALEQGRSNNSVGCDPSSPTYSPQQKKVIHACFTQILHLRRRCHRRYDRRSPHAVRRNGEHGCTRSDARGSEA